MKILDLHVLNEQLENAEAEYDEENDFWFKSIYLGTMMSLIPSGKYYTPFAYSDVEICDSCAHVGDVPCTSDNPCTQPDDPDVPDKVYYCEACKDAKWYQQVEEELLSIDAYLYDREGCATDLFIRTIVEPDVST